MSKQTREYRLAYYRKNAERLRARALAWRNRNKEKVNRQQREASRRRRRENPEKVRTWERAYRARPEVRAKKKLIHKRWLAAHRDEWLRRRREKRKANIEAYREAGRQAELRRKARKMTDAKYYHKRLALNRVQHCRARLRMGKLYHPRHHLRIPEWATMGGGMDFGSPWLAENITPSQRAFARELAIERMEWRNR